MVCGTFSRIMTFMYPLCRLCQYRIHRLYLLWLPCSTLSITDQEEQLHLLLEPLIPLPVVVRPDDAPE